MMSEPARFRVAAASDSNVSPPRALDKILIQLASSYLQGDGCLASGRHSYIQKAWPRSRPSKQDKWR